MLHGVGDSRPVSDVIMLPAQLAARSTRSGCNMHTMRWLVCLSAACLRRGQPAAAHPLSFTPRLSSEERQHRATPHSATPQLAARMRPADCEAGRTS